MSENNYLQFDLFEAAAEEEELKARGNMADYERKLDNGFNIIRNELLNIKNALQEIAGGKRADRIENSVNAFSEVSLDNLHEMLLRAYY